MIVKEDIIKWVEDNSGDAGYFPVGVDISKRKIISLYIDSLTGVSISDCAVLSRRISEHFGERLNAYSLIVSSSGLDRPFTHPQQFIKYTGKKVTVLLNDGKTLIGELYSFSDTELVLSVPPSKKKESQQTILVLRNQIKEVKPVISFK